MSCLWSLMIFLWLLALWLLLWFLSIVVFDDVMTVPVTVSVVDAVVVGVADEEVGVVVVMFSWPLDSVYVFKLFHNSPLSATPTSFDY